MSLLNVTVTVTPAPAAITALQAANVTVAVTGTGATPSGTVKLTCGGYSSAASVLANGSAVIAVPGSMLAVGSNTLTATYTPDVNSDAVYNTGTTGTATLTVSAVSMTPCKLQGYLAQLLYTPVSGGAQQTFAGLKNLDGEFSAEELDSSDHGGGWKGRMYGLLDFSATAEVDYIAGDAGQEMFLSALINRQPVNVVLTPKPGAGSGVDQYAGQVVISSFKWSGKLKDLQSATMAIKNAANTGFTVTAQ